MNKLAQQKIASYYYNLGSQSALGMNKTAGISSMALRKALATPNSREHAAIFKALGERFGGMSGTITGTGMGYGIGSGISAAAELHPLTEALLTASTGAGGMALGNIIGRNVGGGMGYIKGRLAGLGPLNALGNVMADPLGRVPGIRG